MSNEYPYLSIDILAGNIITTGRMKSEENIVHPSDRVIRQ